MEQGEAERRAVGGGKGRGKEVEGGEKKITGRETGNGEGEREVGQGGSQTDSVIRYAVGSVVHIRGNRVLLAVSL